MHEYVLKSAKLMLFNFNKPVGHPIPFPPQNYMNSVVDGFFLINNGILVSS